MHIPLTFQLFIKRQLFFQTSSTLRIIPTNHPQRTPFKNNNSYHSITYPPYFNLLFTQLLFHHKSHITNSIPFPDHHNLDLPFIPNIQAPCPLNLTSCKQHTTHNNHTISQFFTNFYPLSTQTTKITSSNPHPKSHIWLPSYCKPNLHAPGCGRHLPYYGRWVPPTPTFGLVGTYNNN